MSTDSDAPHGATMQSQAVHWHVCPVDRHRGTATAAQNKGGGGGGGCRRTGGGAARALCPGRECACPRGSYSLGPRRGQQRRPRRLPPLPAPTAQSCGRCTRSPGCLRAARPPQRRPPHAPPRPLQPATTTTTESPPAVHRNPRLCHTCGTPKQPQTHQRCHRRIFYLASVTREAHSSRAWRNHGAGHYHFGSGNDPKHANTGI